MPVTYVVAGSEAELVADLRSQVSAAMAGHAGGGPPPAARRRELAEQYTAEALDAHARQALDKGQSPLSAQVEARVARAVIDHLTGAGGLQQLLDNPQIENINANGCDEVFIRYTGGGYEAGPPIADSDEAMINMIRVLASEAAFADNNLGHGEERGFDRNNPQLDLRLKDGARLCAVMAVSRRPGLSIRRPTLINADLDDLAGRGMLDHALCKVLQAAMRAKLNIIFAGGTNTGKTTFARAAARAIPPHERLITIEDAYELELKHPVAHPNVLAFQARRANLEGVGAVPMAALVRTALRMDPDRVIVGETRGDEVRCGGATDRYPMMRFRLGSRQCPASGHEHGRQRLPNECGVRARSWTTVSWLQCERPKSGIGQYGTSRPSLRPNMTNTQQPTHQLHSHRKPYGARINGNRTPALASRPHQTSKSGAYSPTPLPDKPIIAPPLRPRLR